MLDFWMVTVSRLPNGSGGGVAVASNDFRLLDKVERKGCALERSLCRDCELADTKLEALEATPLRAVERELE